MTGGTGAGKERTGASFGRRGAIAVLLALGLGIGVRDVARSWFFPLKSQQLDLRVVYCAGQGASAGANPYALEPIRTCEHTVATRPLRDSPNLAMPFTLPGYDIPFAELFARFSIDGATVAYTALSLLALAVGIVLVARALDAGIVPVLTGLALSVGFPSVPLGQLGTFELLAVAASGWALARGHDRWAGVFAATALFEPHIGAFVVVAVAALVPRARATLVLCCAGLAVAAVAFSSLREQIAYATQYLPGQAYASLHGIEQYSLSYVATLLGASDRVALAIGTASTLLLLIVSVLVARACVALGERAAIAFIPAAFATIGGTYMHLTQVALAVPAVLLFVRVAPNRLAAAFASAGFVLLAVPWPFPAQTKQLLVISLLWVGLATWHVTRGKLRIVLATVAVCWLLMLWSENHLPPAETVPVVPRYPAGTPISVEYRNVVDQVARVQPFELLVKVPTWCGLLAALGAGILVLPGARARPA